MLPVKITTIGSSSGIILPEEVMAQLGVKKGDTLYLIKEADGSYRLTPHDPEFQRQMQTAEDIMHEDWEILRTLAK